MEILEKICAIKAISGKEQTALNELRELFGADFDSIYSDNVGNIIMVKKCGKENAKKILLDAHLDTIGLMVTEVFDDGFVSVCGIGGVDPKTLPAGEVTIHGKNDVYGVVVSTPPHLGGGAVPKMENILIDTGINDKSLKDTVSVGDYVSIQGYYRESNGYAFSRGLDDRACLCSCIMAALNAKNPLCDIYVVASCMEEVGAFGARNAVFEIKPDFVIATDVTFARENEVEERYSIECGKGPSFDLSPILDRAFIKEMMSLAKENDLPFQRIVESGRTGTNADAISIVGCGTRLALMSLPLKAMHTVSEAVKLSDVEALAGILELVITKWEGLK